MSNNLAILALSAASGTLLTTAGLTIPADSGPVLVALGVLTSLAGGLWVAVKSVLKQVFEYLEKTQAADRAARAEDAKTIASAIKAAEESAEKRDSKVASALELLASRFDESPPAPARRRASAR